MLRELFFNTGAFDETFCGHYAFPERDWLRRLESMRAAGAIQSGVLPVNLEHINDTQIMDSKTYGLVRKEGRDDAAWDDIIEWKKFVDHPQPIINRLPWKQIR